MSRLRAIDLCCGGGGWACAARGLQIEIVAAVDLWEPACKTYRLNHPDTHVVQADLREYRTQAILEDIYRPDGGYDLVLGGIPCEWLSQCRSLTSVTDAERARERETLDTVLALVEEWQPLYWCLEDVIQIVRELPPLTPYMVLDARHWSAQARKRAFVGRFPAPRKPEPSDARTLADVLRPGPYRIGRRAADREIKSHRTFGPKTTLGAWPNRKGRTVICMHSGRDAELVLVDDALAGGRRQIEWQEFAALQGFPSDYVFWGSPTDAMTMIGRAVQIDLARAILRAICDDAFPAATDGGVSPNERSRTCPNASTV